MRREKLTWIFFLNLDIIWFRHVHWVWFINGHLNFIWDLQAIYREYKSYYILFEFEPPALITVLTFLMTSYGFGTGTSTFTGYGICCNGKFTWVLLSHPAWIYYNKIATSIGNGVKTDLDHFVRLRNRYFHFVWNLVAGERASFSFYCRVL